MPQCFNLQEKLEIHREECAIEKRTLGTWINPAGHMTHIDPTVQSEYAVILGQAQQLETSIMHSNMNRYEVHMIYHGVLRDKLRYALAVTILSERELKKHNRQRTLYVNQKSASTGIFQIQQCTVLQYIVDCHTLPFILNKAANNSNYSFAPSKNKDDTGDLARLSLEQEQQESSDSIPILSKQASIWYKKWTTPTWIGSIKKLPPLLTQRCIYTSNSAQEHNKQTTYPSFRLFKYIMAINSMKNWNN